MPRRYYLAVLALLAAAAPVARAADALWTATAQTMPRQIIAYATVVPRSLLRLRAGIDGTVANLKVQPGDTVTAGEALGQLAGPSISALLAARQAAANATDATVKAAQQQLASERQKFAARLTTRDAVARAAAALSNAQANRDSAHAALDAADDMASIRTLQAGRVLSVEAFSGERVSAGATVLTLLPANDLWLRATVYGPDANVVALGMTGRFAPAGGGPTAPVTMRAVVGALGRDGGQTVYLEPAATTPTWLDGETGTVSLDAGMLSGVVVPTRALILDRAKWWVLVHTAKGNAPQEVTPGPSRGALTLITQGLAPGSAVVIENPYLDFHRSISEHYQPPN